MRELLLSPVSPPSPSLVYMRHKVPSCWCVPTCAGSENMGSVPGGARLAEGMFGVCFSVLVRTLLERDTESDKIPSTMFTVPFTNHGIPFPVCPSCQGHVYLLFQRLMPPRTALGRNHGNKYLITESPGPDKWPSKDFHERYWK